MKLLREEIWGDIETKVEQDEKSKSYYITCEHSIQVGLVNRNNRLYPKPYVQKDINRYVEEMVNGGRAWGEFGHPPNAKINEERISHRFVDIWPVNENYYGTKAKVMNDGLGKIVRSLIDDGEGKLGQSTRAVGSITEKDDGIEEVNDDLYFITAGDIVADPSAQKAFVSGICEGVEYEWMNGVLIEKAKDILDKAHKPTATVEEKRKSFLDAFRTICEELPVAQDNSGSEILTTEHLRKFNLRLTTTLSIPEIQDQFHKTVTGNKKVIYLLSIEPVSPENIFTTGKKNSYILNCISDLLLFDSDLEQIRTWIESNMDVSNVKVEK